MAELLKRISLLLLTEQCFEEYFINLNFFDVPCLKASISKVLGMGIIAGSILVKLPQILKIIQNKSGEGINIIGVNLELFAMTATVAYSYVRGFPFSSWGDGIFLGIQTAAVAALILFFGGHQGKAGAFVLAYSLLLVTLMGGITPLGVLWFLQACNIPIVCIGKMIQGYTNYKNGSTGQLSAITCFMLFFGSTARIFTSIQETGDPIIILTFCISSLANCVIVGQLLYYWKPKMHIKKD